MGLQDITRPVCANLPAREKGVNIFCQRLLGGAIAVMLTSFTGIFGLTGFRESGQKAADYA